MSYRPERASLIAPTGTEVFRYVRSATGDDGNSGLSPAAAWQTLGRGLGFLGGNSPGQRRFLDVSDSSFAANEQLNMSVPVGGFDGDLDLGATGPDNFLFRTPGQIRATLQQQQALTITNVAADPVTGIVTLTVSEALVPGAHVDELVVGAGVLQYGVCVSNDANTLFVASRTTTWTAPVATYVPSTSFTFGDGASSFQQAFYAHLLANFTFQGIDFRANGAAQTALTVFPGMPFNAQLCRFEGIILEGGASHAVLDACSITRRWGQNGASATVRSSFFNACAMNNHGDGANGQHAYEGCVWDGCEPVLSGNAESRMGVQMLGCEISNGQSDGLIFRGANRGTIVNTRIRDCNGDGILVDAPVLLRLTQVVGSGNANFGASLHNGAQIDSDASTTLTGGAGDVELGGAGATAWGAAPATDVGAAAPEFCRIF